MVDKISSITPEYEEIHCSSRSNARRFSMLASLSYEESSPSVKPNEHTLINTGYKISEYDIVSPYDDFETTVLSKSPTR
ncbi:hypothetical protein OGATHE_000163 [Ogataea polymorpha]|uniref:Uncharacterized protein n=1 Tax=Ogataea polymorpha TaxID=460523 RepID=A0A9P8PUF8_9ASCO|nr:hypothetical protein OGATHE_000163 [Ogataea polymorpha]